MEESRQWYMEERIIAYYTLNPALRYFSSDIDVWW